MTEVKKLIQSHLLQHFLIHEYSAYSFLRSMILVLKQSNSSVENASSSLSSIVSASSWESGFHAVLLEPGQEIELLKKPVGGTPPAMIFTRHPDQQSIFLEHFQRSVILFTLAYRRPQVRLAGHDHGGSGHIPHVMERRAHSVFHRVFPRIFLELKVPV